MNTSYNLNFSETNNSILEIVVLRWQIQNICFGWKNNLSLYISVTINVSDSCSHLELFHHRNSKIH